jgi:cytochrome c biogenesis protein CcmG/thiol:disulfide interchange protein DsbE
MIVTGGTGMPCKLRTLALIMCAAALLALPGCKKSTSAEGQTASSTKRPAPEANMQIPTLDGAQATLDQYKGKVVVVNFWATWCQPCNIEIPWLIEFNQKYGPKGLVILGVAMDDDGKKAVEPYVQKKEFKVNGQPEHMNYPILLGSDKIAEKFGGLIGLPTSMLYSRDGKKVKTIVGLINYDDLVKALESQL